MLQSHMCHMANYILQTLLTHFFFLVQIFWLNLFKRTLVFKTQELNFIKESQQRASEFSSFLKKKKKIPFEPESKHVLKNFKKMQIDFQYIKAASKSKLDFGRNSLRYFDSYAKTCHRGFERLVDFVVHCMYNSMISAHFSWGSNPFFVFTFLCPCCYFFLLAAIFCTISFSIQSIVTLAGNYESCNLTGLKVQFLS